MRLFDSLKSKFAKGKASNATPIPSGTHKSGVPDPGGAMVGNTKLDDLDELSDDDREALLQLKATAEQERILGGQQSEEPGEIGGGISESESSLPISTGVREDEGDPEFLEALENSKVDQGGDRAAQEERELQAAMAASMQGGGAISGVDGLDGEDIPLAQLAEIRQQQKDVGPMRPFSGDFGTGMNFDDQAYNAKHAEFERDMDQFTNNRAEWNKRFEPSPAVSPVVARDQKDIFWQTGDPEPEIGESAKVPATTASFGSMSMEAEEEQSWEAPSRHDEIMAGFKPNLSAISPTALEHMRPEERQRYEESQRQLTEAQLGQYLKSRKGDLVTQERGDLGELSPEERAVVESSRREMDERDNRDLAAELPSRAARLGARDRYMLKAGRRGDAKGGLARSRAAAAERKAQEAAKARQAEATWAQEDDALPREYPALAVAEQEPEEEFAVPTIMRGGRRDSYGDEDRLEDDYVANRNRAENRRAPAGELGGLLDQPGGLLDEPGGLLDEPEKQGDGGVIFDGKETGLLDARPVPEGAGGLNPRLEAARADLANRKRFGGGASVAAGSLGPGDLDSIAEEPEVENAIDDTPDRGSKERQALAANRAAEQELMSSTAAGIDDAYEKFKAGPGAFAKSVVQPSVFSQPQRAPSVEIAQPPVAQGQQGAAGARAGGGWLGKIGSAIASPFKALWRGLKSVGNALNPWNEERTQARATRARERREAEFDRRWDERQRVRDERNAALDEEEARKEREIPGYKEQKEQNARKFEEERLAKTPDKELSKDDYFKKKGIHSANTAEANYHEYELREMKRTKTIWDMPKKGKTYYNAQGEIVEEPDEISSPRNPYAADYEAQKNDLEQSRLWSSDPKVKERLVQQQQSADENQKTLDYKVGALAGKVGLNKVRDYFAPPQVLMGSNAPDQKLAAYTDRDDEEARKLQQEAMAAVPGATQESSSSGVGDKIKNVFNSTLNKIDSTRVQKPSQFKDFSDEEWQNLSKADRTKLMNLVAQSNENDVESGKAAGLIDIDPNELSTAKVHPAETKVAVGTGLAGSDAERKLAMQEAKNNNKLEADRLRREFDEKNRNRPQIPEGALWDKIGKSPLERDMDALKEHFNLGAPKEQPTWKDKFKSFF